MGFTFLEFISNDYFCLYVLYVKRFTYACRIPKMLYSVRFQYERCLQYEKLYVAGRAVINLAPKTEIREIESNGNVKTSVKRGTFILFIILYAFVWTDD